jgi:hypothetical protein
MSDLAVSPALPATTDGAAAVTSPADPADRPGRPRMWHRLRRAVQGGGPWPPVPGRAAHPLAMTACRSYPAGGCRIAATASASAS